MATLSVTHLGVPGPHGPMAAVGMWFPALLLDWINHQLSALTFSSEGPHLGIVMFLKRPFLCALVLFGTRLPRLAARPLLVFLIDGFRHDYVGDLQNLPGFGELVHHGVKVDYMTPDFPSLSFPNYYTLMTGNHSVQVINYYHTTPKVFRAVYLVQT